MVLHQLLSTLQLLGIELAIEGEQLRIAAPPGVMTPELRGQLRTHKQEIIEFLKRIRHEETKVLITPIPRNERLRLSYAQQRLWFLAKLESGANYNMPLVLEFEGQLIVAALQQTLSEIVRRHESLRTTFAMHEGVPYQMVQPPLAVRLPVVDLRSITSHDAQSNEVKRLSEIEAMKPFDLTQDVMLRAQVLQLTEERFVLLLTMHHIAADGWSVGVLLRELAALYTCDVQSKPSALPELPIQYADFAAWQRAYLQGAVLERQLTWWKAQLADIPDLLQLPSDRPRPTQQSFRGESVSLQIEAALTQKLRQLSHTQGCTLYMTLLAAFQVLLYRYTGQEQIVVGSPIANRNHKELEGLIGFLVNTMALRCNLTGNPTFLDVLAQVQQTTQAAYEHQDLPFERLVEELRPERNLTYNPLIQVVFVLQNVPTRAFTLPGIRVTPAMTEIRMTRSDLEVHLWEMENELNGVCIYATDLFDAATITRMLGHFQELLKGIVDNPNQTINALPLLTPLERNQVLVDWASGDEPVEPDAPPKAQCFHYLFEEQVAHTPDVTAVVMAGASIENQQLTYAELNTHANQLAHHLQSLGIGGDLSNFHLSRLHEDSNHETSISGTTAETLVGICLERSIEMVVGLLGIFKAGGAYVPLDPTYPPDRFAFMLQDAAPHVIVTQSKYRSLFPTTARLICLDTDDALVRSQPVHNPCTFVTAANLAYVIYTSGSTGQSKGVLLEHGGLYNLALAQIEAFGVQPGHRVLQVASLNFDASISEIVMALGAGATLVLAPAADLLPGPALTQTLQQQAITHVTLVPTALTLLEPETLPRLKTLIAVGEACPAALGARWAQGRHFFNAYGPTEITVCATIMDGAHWHHRQHPPPIGRPMANTQIYLLDQCRQPVPIGIPGEIYIGGAGVARGYLNRPALTAGKFITNHLGEGRLYKTGDLARWLPDGYIEFLGRIDQQIKLRGFRIELGEIEALLNQHPAVQEAVVIARASTPEADATGLRLVAYIVTEEARGSQGEIAGSTLLVSLSDLRSYLQTKLPDYMVPSAFVVLGALPLTPNGKVDRKALPAPGENNLASAKVYMAPQTETEVQLVAIWCAVLGVEQVGIHDNFFERGGHSLLTVQLMQQIHTHFTTAIPLQRLFAEPTIAGLAAQIDAEQLASATPPSGTSSTNALPVAHQAPPSCLVPLRTSGSRPPFFCVHPLAGVVFPYYELAYRLGAEQPIYGLQAVGLAGKEAPLQTLAAMATHYRDALQTVQPVGPYYLGGWSLGGLIAYVMAQQFQAVGETVACLAIIDTPAPSGQFTSTLGDVLRFGVNTLAPALGAYVADYLKLWRQRQPDLPLPAPHRLLRVTLANARAGRRYRWQPYAGRVTLLRSTQDFGSIGQSLDLGWSDFASGGVDVVPVPGEHMTLLRQPHVPIVAERLTACLTKAWQQSLL